MKNSLSLILIIPLISFTLNCNRSGSKPSGDDHEGMDTNGYKSSLLILSGDSMEGRLPGSRGGMRAANFVASQFKNFGLTPISAEQGYFQQVNIHCFHPDYSAMTAEITGNNLNQKIKPFEELLLISNQDGTNINIEGELVNVGYGTVAPEYNWDDYKDVDVKDKIVVCLFDHPDFRHDRYIKGQTTYYGTFHYKSEIAYRKGARGIVFIFRKNGLFQFNGWQKYITNMSFGDYSFCSKIPMIAFVKEESFNKAIKGQFDDLVEKAKEPDFHPYPLSLQLQIRYRQETKNYTSPNVIGFVKGTAFPDEAVIFMSHYDHLGINEPVNGDSIYNGSIDNASGTAGVITLAQYFSKHPAKRSIIFMATTAEEMAFQGVLHYINNPVIPLQKTIAGINLDMMNLLGKSDFTEIIPLSCTDAVEPLRHLSGKNNLQLILSDFDKEYLNFRVESYPFALHDVVVINLVMNLLENKSASLTHEKLMEILNSGGLNYHTPFDEVKSWFRYDGILQQLELARDIAVYYADEGKKPVFDQNNPFSPAKAMWVENK